MSYKANKSRFENTEIMAAIIGEYACCRNKVLAFSFPDLYDRMYESGRLKEHLEDVQLVMDSYMKDYTKIIMNSNEYKKVSMSEGYEKAYNSIAEPRIKAEENRIGNRWVCVKDPYADEYFMEWLAAAKIFGMLTEKKCPDRS